MKASLSIFSLANNVTGLHMQTMNTKLEMHARAESEWDVLKRRLEEDVKSGLDKKEILSRELEDARRGRDAARRDTLIKKVCTFFCSCLLVIHLIYFTRTPLHICIHAQLQRQQLSHRIITQTFNVLSLSSNLSGLSFHHLKPVQPNSGIQTNDYIVPAHPNPQTPTAQPSFSFVCRLEIMASTSSNLVTRNFSDTVQMSFVTLAENFN